MHKKFVLLFLFPRNGQFGALLENLWTFLHIFVSILVLPQVASLFEVCDESGMHRAPSQEFLGLYARPWDIEACNGS